MCHNSYHALKEKIRLLSDGNTSDTDSRYNTEKSRSVILKLNIVKYATIRQWPQLFQNKSKILFRAPLDFKHIQIKFVNFLRKKMLNIEGI